MILEITGFIKGDAARQSWAASLEWQVYQLIRIFKYCGF